MNPSELVVKWKERAKQHRDTLTGWATELCASELEEALKEQEKVKPAIPESELPTAEDIQAIYRSYKTTEPDKE